MRFQGRIALHCQCALDESRIVYLWVGRRIDVDISLLFLRRGAPCRWIHHCGSSLLLLRRRVYDCGVTFFLFRRWSDIGGFLLARSEQAQHSQQVNGFFHITLIVSGSHSVVSLMTVSLAESERAESLAVLTQMNYWECLRVVSVGKRII